MRTHNTRYSALCMSDRWAGRTALRRSWLQFEAVELPVRSLTADTALNHCGRRARSSVRERGRRKLPGPAADVSARGLAALRLPSGRQAGPDWPGTISWLRATSWTRSIPLTRWRSCGQCPAGDGQITWPTATRTVPDLACVIADGYSVRARIAPKQ